MSNKQGVRTFSSNKKLVRERRNQIVGAARRVFLENGFHETGMRNIAKSCHLTIGSLYHYIGSKEDILRLIVEHSIDQLEVLKRFRQGLNNLSATEMLTECIAKYFQITYDDRDIVMLYEREIRQFSKRDRDYLLKTAVGIVEFFEDLLNMGEEKGEFELSFSQTTVAFNIHIMAHALATRDWFLKDRYPLEKYIKEQTSIILSGVKKSPNLKSD